MDTENATYLENNPEARDAINALVTALRRDTTSSDSSVFEFGVKFFEQKTSKTPPLVFAGPSGVGKGTLVNLLMERFPDKFGFSVSHTTRQPREGEQNGVHYHFVPLEDMEAAIGRGEFVEYARVHTNMYGTSIKAIGDVQSKGKICILDIDIQGVQKVKESSLQCKYIFISPPSMEELESRLRNRGTETEDKIQIRLKTAHDEMAFGNTPGNFDANVTNKDVELAFSEIVALLRKWYPSLGL